MEYVLKFGVINQKCFYSNTAPVYFLPPHIVTVSDIGTIETEIDLLNSKWLQGY